MCDNVNNFRGAFLDHKKYEKILKNFSSILLHENG